MKLIRRILGVVLALGGTLIIIEIVPLYVWYIVLGVLGIALIMLLCKII